MTYEEALRKASACLRLSKSSNAAEASLAAAKAQEIMDRYGITTAAAELETGTKATPEEPIQDFNRETVLTACQKDKQWALQLTVIVAKANGCKTYYHHHNGGSASYLIGRASDVATARYMIALLSDEVRRIARDCTKGYSDKYRRDFKYGVVEAIRVKFDTVWNKAKQEARQEVSGNPLALMRVDQAVLKLEQRVASVEAWTEKNKKLGEAGRSNYKVLSEARSHGFQEGQKVQLNRAKAGLKQSSTSGLIH